MRLWLALVGILLAAQAQAQAPKSQTPEEKAAEIQLQKDVLAALIAAEQARIAAMAAAKTPRAK